MQQFSFLPDSGWVIVILVLCIFLKLFLKPWAVILAGFLLGFCWVLAYVSLSSAWVLPDALEGKPILIRGFIASIPEVANHRTSFLFALDTVDGKAAHGKVRLSWQNEKVKCKVGDAWSFPVKLKKIHGTMNPGGFDYEAWSLQQGIKASGYIIKPHRKFNFHPKKHHHWNKRFIIDRVRQYFFDLLVTYLPKSHTSPWIIALAVGERKGIDAASWQVLRHTGTNHLMAIAGLHIGFMSAFIYAFIMWCWRRIPRFALKLPSQHAACLGSLIMALLYSAMAGFSIPTQRACLMLLAYLLTVLSKRRVTAWHTWALALMGVLCLNPLTVLTESFWLSFGSVALIIFGMKGRLSPKGLWWKHGRIQWVIAVGLIPLGIWLFQECSIVSFLANSIAIPWVGFLIVPLTLFGCFSLLFSTVIGCLCLRLADTMMQLLWSILVFLSEFSWSSWDHAVPSLWIVIAACIGFALLLLPMGFSARWLGLFWILPLITYKTAVPNKGDFTFTLLDVGQGLSGVVRTHKHSLVFDAGLKLGENYDMGESVVLPFLRTSGVQQLSMLVVSHGDNDHRGGAEAIIRYYPHLQIKTSVPMLFPEKKVSYCLSGESWNWDGVSFSFLYPTLDHLGLGNDSSCVLKISAGKHSLLLTGDIERFAEEYLVMKDSHMLSAEIMVAPHHGSKTSGLDAFIDDVNPAYVLIPAGYRNRYRLPSQIILEKYKNKNILTLNTVETGAITVEFSSSKGVSPPSSYRLLRKRYWFS